MPLNPAESCGILHRHPARIPLRIPRGHLSGAAVYLRKVKGGWRAEVERQGVRTSATRASKADAQAWGMREEAAILAGARGEYPDRTLAEAIERYRREVTDKKRNQRADHLRFDAFLRDFPTLAGKVMHKVTADDLAAWQRARLSKVSASSVLREAQQLRPVWTLAKKQWKWIGESPWPDVTLPSKGHARTRRAAWQEIRLLLRSVGYRRSVPPAWPQQEAIWCYVVALHTAMRSGEILRMSRSTVDLKRRVYRLDQHKTDAAVGARLVPFTRRAARVLTVLDAAAEAAGRDAYFTITDASRDVLYRKIRDRLMIDGLRFHDARGTALTWLARRYDVMTLAKISGHVDINQLFTAYYRESVEDVAARL